MIKKHIIFASAVLLFCLTSVTSYSTILKVTNLNDSGSGSLRATIASASSGDTVMMDVSGQIALASPISITTPVFIMGAYPIHNRLSGPSSGGGEAFIINGVNTDTVVINGFNISDFAGANGAISITNSLVRIGDCVFEDNVGTANGQCIFATGTSSDVKVFGCSFFNNDAGGAEGGAAFVGAGAKVSFFNCTFFQNNANIGGAISTYGDLIIINNTFYNNSAGTGNNISRATGSTVTLANNIFSNVTGANAFSNSGPNWNNLGGNVLTFIPPSFVTSGGDMTGISQVSLGLQGTATIDGYGLKYFRLTQQTSPAVDNGVTPAALPQFDCRRAPRIIYGDSGLMPDAGASEFTPYRVTSAISPNDFESVWSQMNLSGGFGGPEYMEFDLGGPTNFALSSTMSYTANPLPRIVDGYTQSGSAIAGPRDPFSAGTYVTPAFLPVALLQVTGGVLDIDIWPQGSWIAGLRIDNGPGNGILMTDCQMQFYGNHVISSASNGLNGIVVNGFSSNVVVGGSHYYEMNVIGNQMNSVMSSGINVGGVNTKIRGNFIGTTTDGLATLPNSIGITIQPGSGTTGIGGNYENPTRNLISGNLNKQIDISGTSVTNIQGNIIGPDISTATLLNVGAIGIDIHANTDGAIGGVANGYGNIIGGNNAGAILTSSNTFTIFGNYIGISPYASNGYAAIPNATGIAIIGNGTHVIGNGSYGGRNYFSMNSGEGLYLDGADLQSVNGNYFGLRPDQSLGGNASHGIHLVNTSSQNQIVNNIISGNDGSGIFLNSTGSFNAIKNNHIGVDSVGNTAFANTVGISLNNTTNDEIAYNIISGNATEAVNGMIVTNLNLHHNTIGLNATSNAAVSNGASGIYLNNVAVVAMDTNIISANNNKGIELLNAYDFQLIGNLIGTDPAGNILGNNNDGIYVETSSIGKIGITGSGNKISNNAGAGVKINGSDSVSIRSNSTLNNNQLGISLNNSTSVLVNDLNDADATGASLSNSGQNYPVITGASVCATGTTSFTGTVNVDDPTANYYLEFFIVGTPDPSGHGEGDSLIQVSTINAGGLNTFPFTVTIPAVLPVGTIISATSAKDLGAGFFETSEFSDTIQVRGGFTADATVINNIICNGAGNGAAYVTNNSGIFPITYQWYDAGTGSPLATQTNDTAVFVVPGDYYCIVTDGTSCSVLSDTITITEPATLNVTSNANWETCAGLNDGSTDLVINSGGTPNYTFDWYNSSAVLLSTTANIPIGSVNGISSLAPDNYFTVVTDANGCQDTLLFTINPGLSVNSIFSSGVTTVCTGTPVTFTDFSTPAASVTAWSYDFGDATTSSLQNPTHTWASSGTYTVTLIAFAGTCSDTSGTTIVVEALPASNAGADQVICDGTTVTFAGSLTNAVSSYWTTNGSGTFTDTTTITTNYTHSTTDIGTTIEVYLTAVSSGTCPNDTDTLLLTVYALPTSSAGIDQTICSINAATLSGVTTNAPTQSWSSSGSGTFDDPTLLNAIYTPSASDISAGTVTLTLTTSSNGACAAASDVMVLTIVTSPTVNAGPDTNICRTGTVFITLNGTTSAPTYSWSTSGSGSWVNSSTLTPDYYFSGADVSGATTTLYLTATQTGCPSVTDSLLITYHTAPSSYAGIDDTLCGSAPAVSLSGSASNQSSVIWTNGAGTYSPNATTSATVYNPTAGEISFGGLDLYFTAVATNAACPDYTDTMTVVFLTAPVSVAGADATICNGTSYSLDGTGSTGTITAYQWSQVGVGVIGSTAVISVNPAATTSYALMVDNGTCQSYDTLTITVNAFPDSTFSFSQSAFCMNAGTQVPIAATTGGTYASLQPGLAINTSTGDIDPGTSTTGTYDVVYTITSPCFADDTIQITINGLPDANFTSATPYCAFDGNDTLVPVTTGGTFSGTGITDGTIGIFSPLSAGAGTHVITYTITDGNSCTSLIDNSIVVNANPIVNLNPVSPTFCTSDPPVTLTATPPGGIFALNTTTILTGGVFDPSTAPIGNDTLVYLYYDSNGCPGIDYQFITVNTGPTPPVTGSTTINYCQGDVINPLTVSSTNTVNWYSDATLSVQIGTGTTLTLPQNLSGVNVFYVTQTVGTCTSLPTVITVTVIDGSAINMGGPYFVCPDQPVQLNVSGATGTVTWSPGSTLSDSTIINPIATPPVTTTYYVFTTISGCTVIDSVTVNVDPACLENVYNAFSPNGDNINETWIIEGAYTNSNNKVMIFNRWGDKLIELNNYDNVNVVWDGTYKGNILPAGTYFYIIEYRDLQKQFNGWVQITK